MHRFCIKIMLNGIKLFTKNVCTDSVLKMMLNGIKLFMYRFYIENNAKWDKTLCTDFALK